MKGSVGLGVGISLGPLGSVSIQPKIDISSVIEWKNKQLDLVKQRINGNLSIRLISGKQLKKSNCQVIFKIGNNPNKLTFKLTFSFLNTFLFL
jgi:hypothetical protein